MHSSRWVLHVDAHAHKARKLGPELGDDVVCQLATVPSWFEMDDDLPQVGTTKGVGSAAADRGYESGDVGVLVDDLRDLILIVDQLGVRRPLCRFGRDGNLIGVLIGNEPLRHDEEEPCREHEDDGKGHHCRRAMAEDDLQSAVVRAKQTLERRLRRAGKSRSFVTALLGWLVSGFEERLHSMGVSVTETMPEMRIATQIVTENSRNRRPSTPPMNRTGMNTAASDSVIETIVKPISREPTSEAVSGSSPSSTCR